MSAPSHTQPHRHHAFAPIVHVRLRLRLEPIANAALHFSDMCDYPRGGVVADARAADVRTKSGSKQPVFSPTGAKGAKLDKPLNADQIKRL